jgi:hypothetical protein
VCVCSLAPLALQEAVRVFTACSHPDHYTAVTGMHLGMVGVVVGPMALLTCCALLYAYANAAYTWYGVLDDRWIW